MSVQAFVPWVWSLETRDDKTGNGLMLVAQTKRKHLSYINETNLSFKGRFIW